MIYVTDIGLCSPYVLLSLWLSPRYLHLPFVLMFSLSIVSMASSESYLASADSDMNDLTDGRSRGGLARRLWQRAPYTVV